MVNDGNKQNIYTLFYLLIYNKITNNPPLNFIKIYFIEQ